MVKRDYYDADAGQWVRVKPPSGQVVVVPIERRAKSFRFVTKYDHVVDSLRYAQSAVAKGDK